MFHNVIERLTKCLIKKCQIAFLLPASGRSGRERETQRLSFASYIAGVTFAIAMIPRVKFRGAENKRENQKRDREPRRDN